MMSSPSDHSLLLTPKYIAETLAAEAGVPAAQEKDGWVAPCPCPDHHDHHASLLISKGKTREVVFHCRAGCDIRDISKALRERNLWPQRKKKRKVAEYDYYDSQRNYLFSKLRFLKDDGKKTFEIGVPDETAPNGWRKGLPRLDRKPLYHLPELVEAPEGSTVFVVEGEKDADNLAQLGKVAVCNHDGAGKWSEEFSDYFAGTRVVILPDNDTAGRKHAKQVAEALSECCDVRVLELPGLDEKGDVSDWLADGHTVEELDALVDALQQEDEAWETPWQDRLLRTGGEVPKVKNLEYNIVLYLENHEAFADLGLGFDTFEQSIMIRGERLVDTDMIKIMVRLQEVGIDTSLVRVQGAVSEVAHRNTYDSLMDYLEGLEWDGVPRVDNLLIKYFGATEEPEEYVRKVSRVWATLLVARGLSPGCKADQMIVLEGEQGIGKSSGLRALCPKESWFQDQLPNLSTQSKDAKIALQGRWIIEEQEMDATTKANKESTKKFLSTKVDKDRLPYDRTQTEMPRRSGLAGTHNIDGEGYLSDATGNRRFLPVRVTKVDVEALAADRDQIWAEAVAGYREGQIWWTTQDDLEVRRQQDKRFKQTEFGQEAVLYLTMKPLIDPAGDWGDPVVKWVPRQIPLRTFVPKYYMQDRFGKEWLRATWQEREALKGAYMNLGWIKPEAGFRDAAQAEEHGDDPRIKLHGWVAPEGWEHPDNDPEGGSTCGSTCGSTYTRERLTQPEKGPFAENYILVTHSDIKNESNKKGVVGQREGVGRPEVDPYVDPPKTGEVSVTYSTLGQLGQPIRGKELVSVEVGVVGGINRGALRVLPNRLTQLTHPSTDGGVQGGLCSSLEPVKAWLDSLPHDQVIGLDIETTALKPQDGRVRLVQLWAGGVGHVIDVDALPNGLDDLAFLSDRVYVAFNAQFETKWLRRLRLPMEDALLAYAAIWGGTCSLKQAASRFLHEEISKEQQVSDWGAADLSQEQIDYAITDARIALQLWDHFQGDLDTYQVREGYYLLRDVVLPLSDAAGMLFDVDKHDQLISRLEQQVADIHLPDVVDNWNSTQQILAWLEPQLSNPVRASWPRTASGKLSLNKDALAEMLDRLPEGVREVMQGYAERQKLTTVLKTFGRGLADKVYDDGRLYGDLRISGAITGRMASSNPNLQNMPNGGGFRDLFVSPPGRKLVVADYSQIEVRVGGLLADEPVIAESFAAGHDFHTATAAKMTGKPYDQVTKTERKAAKACIAEGSLVLTHSGLKPIELVTTQDLVWDGIQWVEHDGVVCNGVRKVVQYGMLRATPDHVVYFSNGDTGELHEAINEGRTDLAIGEVEGDPIRFLGDCWDRDREGPSEIKPCPVGLVGGVPMQEDWEEGICSYHKSGERQEPREQKLTKEEVPSSIGCCAEVGRTLRPDALPMLQPETQGIQELRGEGNPGGVHQSGGLHILGAGESTPPELQGDSPRSDRQRRELCQRQPPIGYASGELSEQTTRVYDIVNAGPRHRYTVSGVVVSNCTFAMQYGAGESLLAKQLGVSRQEASTYMRQWEKSYPKVTAWRAESLKTGTKQRKLRTAGGRQIKLPPRPRPSPSVCYNYPVQGSAADVMYAALWALYHVLQDHPEWSLLTVVHDEVMLEVPEDEAEEAAAALEEAMRQGYLDIFPEADCTGLVDAGIGDTWGEAK